MAKKQKKLKSLPVTIEIDHRGVLATSIGTYKQQVADFTGRYKSKSGLPAGVIAACVVDLVTRKVVSTVHSQYSAQGKPTL